MSEAPDRPARLTRETKLLIATLTVSVLVLLLLAQLRFPEVPDFVETAAQPLGRLAARAPYDELAAGVARVEASVFPNLVVLQLAGPDEDTPRRLADVLAAPVDDRPRYVPALRTSGITALAALGPDAQVTGAISREGQPAGVARVIATDPLRRLALVNVPQAQARTLPTLPIEELETPAYVVAIEGTSAGITARPIFLGNRDRYSAPRWTRPLLPLGGTAVTPGALIFTLDAQFLGTAVNERGTLAIAEAEDVFLTIDELAAGGDAGPADAGLSVQMLTPALAIATGASTGVVVSDVDPDGPASELVVPGDVVTQVDGAPVQSPEQLLFAIAGAGDEVVLTLVRNGDIHGLTLRLAGPQSAAASAATGATRPMLVADDGGTLVAEIPPGSPLDEAGLLVGDLIVRARDVTAPAPAAVRRALDETEPGDFALLVVRRDAGQLVVAVPGAPPPDDAP